MIGHRAQGAARPHIVALMARGVPVAPGRTGTVIRLLPPLVIEDEALDEWRRDCTRYWVRDPGGGLP